MPTLGSHDYPEFTLSEAIALGGKVAKEFAGEVSRNGLARSLGMSERGGAFAARVGALRMWGIATGRSRLRVSRDGLRAASPLSPQEAKSARRSLARGVPLFLEIQRRLGSSPLDAANLAVIVEEITGADRQEVRARLPVIDRVLADVRPSLIEASEAPASEPGHPPRQAGPATPGPVHGADVAAGSPRAGLARPSPQPGRVELSLPEGVISLPETVANLDAALTVLWAHRQLVAARQASEGRPAESAGPDFTVRRPAAAATHPATQA